VSEPRRFHLRTFGCQMNEHDSERIAGLLQADGLVETDDPEAADVVVLNTCCIRENADNKLYGTLGHLKSVKDRHPGMQLVVAGCLAQKDRETVTDRAPYVDVVLGTHNVHRAAALLH
jgi:tRNA-2-methylthio-N6-dimethylallyladenosine synthase